MQTALTIGGTLAVAAVAVAIGYGVYKHTHPYHPKVLLASRAFRTSAPRLATSVGNRYSYALAGDNGPNAPPDQFWST